MNKRVLASMIGVLCLVGGGYLAGKGFTIGFIASIALCGLGGYLVGVSLGLGEDES